MTETAASRTSAFLLRAVLMAGTLAIIAGIFGMHVMTGSHSMHAQATATAPASHSASAPRALADTVQTDTVHATPHTAHAAASPDTDALSVHEISWAAPPSCSCSGSCTTTPALSASCVPSPQSAPLVAPPPGTAPCVIFNAPAEGAVNSAYSYSPGSPSPGELSISRT